MERILSPHKAGKKPFKRYQQHWRKEEILPRQNKTQEVDTTVCHKERPESWKEDKMSSTLAQHSYPAKLLPWKCLHAKTGLSLTCKYQAANYHLWTTNVGGKCKRSLPLPRSCLWISHSWGKSRGRHRQSATEKPRPGKTALVIMDISFPGKYLFFLFNAMLFWLKCSLIRLDVSCYIKGIDNNAIEQWNREASIWCPCSDLNLGLDQNIHYSQCKFWFQNRLMVPLSQRCGLL